MSSSGDREAKARRPGELAIKYHTHYQGKIQILPKCAVRSQEDFSIWYTPGVAEPCKAIKQDRDAAFTLTNKWNTIAVISDGTRVLGLGDIGPEAALPVMEGKSLIFKYLGGVDAFPLVLRTKDAEEIISTVKLIEPSLGGVNLEDVEKPKCFHILERLRRELEIPVWHDDQQGTALVTLAALLNALKLVGPKLGEASITQIGAGAASIATIKYLIAAGADPKKIVVVDSKGILSPQRRDVLDLEKNPYKWDLCLKTNAEGKTGGIPEALKGADVCISLSKPGPGTIKTEWIRGMADDAIVFACANPVPEIWPWEAKEAGARIVGTGRSDFPNQINNSLGFPGVFRGALQVRSKSITDEMCLAAASAVAKVAEDRGINEENIIPTMDEWLLYVREAVAVGEKAMEQGVARIKLSRQELWDQCHNIIKKAIEETRLLMRTGYISPPPS